MARLAGVGGQIFGLPSYEYIQWELSRAGDNLVGVTLGRNVYCPSGASRNCASGYVTIADGTFASGLYDDGNEHEIAVSLNICTEKK